MRFFYYDKIVWCDEYYFHHVYEFKSYWKWFCGEKREPRQAYTKVSPTGQEIMKHSIKLTCKLKPQLNIKTAI